MSGTQQDSAKRWKPARAGVARLSGAQDSAECRTLQSRQNARFCRMLDSAERRQDSLKILLCVQDSAECRILQSAGFCRETSW
jgi:hypothetical protein